MTVVDLANDTTVATALAFDIPTHRSLTPGVQERQGQFGPRSPAMSIHASTERVVCNKRAVQLVVSLKFHRLTPIPFNES